MFVAGTVKMLFFTDRVPCIYCISQRSRDSEFWRCGSSASIRPATPPVVGQCLRLAVVSSLDVRIRALSSIQ
jgi:hypothetical protein